MTSRLVCPLTAVALISLGLLAGCSDGDTQPLADLVVIADQNIQGIEVARSKDVIAVAETLTLSAVDAVSGADIADDLRWTSSDTAVASVAGAGAVTGVGDGTVTITASIGALEGSTSLNVSSAGILSVAVTSNEVPVDVCTNAQFAATGTYADGRVDDVTAAVDWQSSNTDLADFNVATPGLLVTQIAGNVDVSASLTGVTSPALPVVIADSLSVITVESVAVSIEIGQSTQISALGSFGGTNLDVSGNATFASADETVATIDAAGLATGIETGTSVISATCNGVQGDLTLSVTGSSATLIDLDVVGSAPFTLPLNSTLQLEVEATFEDLSTRTVTEEATWSIAPGSLGAASVSNALGSKGEVTPNFVGTSIVRAVFETEEVTIEVQVTQ